MPPAACVIVIVFVVPVPEAVTAEPTKLSVVAPVERELPSS